MDSIQVDESIRFTRNQEIGNYTIIEEISRGGMGVVYKAVEKNPQRLVAIKIIFEQRSKIAQKRFLREAQLAAKLQHDNIVKIYNAGEISGRLYLVMEYVEGTTLKDLIFKEYIDWKEGLSIVLQIADALGYAHKKSIIHRDVKPENIIVQSDGIAKIADFGLAKSAQLGEYSLTKTGDIMGTPRYMALELLTGKTKDISIQVDIYALGTILFEIVTKVPMIPGSAPLEILYNIENFKPEPLSKYNSDVPDNLEIVWRNAIASKRYRYENMGLFHNDLKNVLENKKISKPSKFSLQFFYPIVTILSILFLLVTLSYFYRRTPDKKNQIDNDRVVIYYFQGISEFDDAQYGKAYETFTSIKEKDSFHMLPFYLGACIYYQQSQRKEVDIKRVQKAIDYLQEAYKIFPHYGDNLYVLAKSYFLLKDYKNAKKYFSKCVELSPGEVEYYNYLAKINFIEKDYEVCVKNIKKAVSLDQGNVVASNLLLNLSVHAPRFQEENWELLENMFFSLKTMRVPILFEKYFADFKQRTYNHYLTVISKQDNQKDEQFYLHIAAKVYLSNKQSDIQQLQDGKVYFQRILERKDEGVHNRYLAAKSLILVHDFEFVADFLGKSFPETDFAGYVIACSVLRSANIEVELPNSFLCKQLNNNEKDAEFLKILLAANIHINNVAYHITNELSADNIKILENLMAESNGKVQVVAASSLSNTSGVDDDLKKKSLFILKNVIENFEDENVRAYAYYYLLQSYTEDGDFDFDYVGIYKKGLEEDSEYINMLCLSLFYKFVKLNLPDDLRMLFFPQMLGSLKVIPNEKFLEEISPYLRKLTKKEKSYELTLRAGCLWAFCVPNENVLVQYLKEKEKESSTTLLRCLIMRFTMLKGVLEGNRYGRSSRNRNIGRDEERWRESNEEMEPFLFYLVTNNDAVLKANLLFVFSLFLPADDIDDKLHEYVKSSILNAMGLNLTLKSLLTKNNKNDIMNVMINNFAGFFFEKNKRNIAKITEFYLRDSSPLIQESSYSSIVPTLDESRRKELYESLKNNDNIIARRGVSNGLYRLLQIQITPIAEDVAKYALYVHRPYNIFVLEADYERYVQRLFSAKEKQKIIYEYLNYAIDLYDKNAKLYYERALIYIANKKFVEARTDLQKAISILPEDFRYTVTLARLEYDMGNVEKALDIIKPIVRLEQNPFILRKIAVLYYQAEKHKEAREVYKKLFLQDPYKKDDLLYVIRSYCKENNNKKALLYMKWLQHICNRKHVNTQKEEDRLHKNDFASEEFDVLKQERIFEVILNGESSK